MRAAISQSNYIPWKGYFDFINTVDIFVLYDDMQYTKRDWRNRNKVMTQNGPGWLSVPVEVKGKYEQKIKDTKISEKGWNKKHWNSIRHAYSKAPFWEDYKDIFKNLYENTSEEYLSQVNYKFISAINKILGITTPLRWSSEFELAEKRTQRLINICKDLGANTYVSGPAAKDYMDETPFKAEGIGVEWMDYSGYPEYPQMHDQPFEHGVSVLDLIFNTGPDARSYMKTFPESEVA